MALQNEHETRAIDEVFEKRSEVEGKLKKAEADCAKVIV